MASPAAGDTLPDDWSDPGSSIVANPPDETDGESEHASEGYTCIKIYKHISKM